jgi:hypothetical protein
MAGTSNNSSTDAWIRLSVALALVTGCTGSVKEAKELLLHWLREGQIRWYFYRQSGKYPETETYEWHLQHNTIRNHDNPDVSPRGSLGLGTMISGGSPLGGTAAPSAPLQLSNTSVWVWLADVRCPAPSRFSQAGIADIRAELDCSR